MSGLLTGKVVVVTGAGGGVGEHIARLAASHGGSIVVNDLGGGPSGEGKDPGPAETVAESIRAGGGNAVASFRSVADWDGAHGIIQDALDAFGRIDVVVNNAGILRDVIFHKMQRSDWELVRSVNLDGCFYVSRAAAPHFKEQASGCFIHMTSTSGLIGNLAQANYSAAKLGVTALSKSIALDMARFNVRSNCIAPFAFTRLVGTIPENDERNRQRLEIARRMTPDKIAPLAVGLMLDGAKDVTGQVFGARMNELILFSQSRPIRSTQKAESRKQKAEGWTPERVVAQALSAMQPSYYPLDRSSDVFTWDPF